MDCFPWNTCTSARSPCEQVPLRDKRWNRKISFCTPLHSVSIGSTSVVSIACGGGQAPDQNKQMRACCTERGQRKGQTRQLKSCEHEDHVRLLPHINSIGQSPPR
ncbi:hypothetical protein BT93_G1090 [Corymbia citriodora subsp. variegata]|nr:hypothetical protein BT93_G1090 [Corymbia citriodora subsp. variegata]